MTNIEQVVERLIYESGQRLGEAYRKLSEQRAEIERLTAAIVHGVAQAKEREAEIERLRAAIMWVQEVHPNKTKEGGAMVEMTWDEFNAMRAALEDKP